MDSCNPRCVLLYIVTRKWCGYCYCGCLLSSPERFKGFYNSRILANLGFNQGVVSFTVEIDGRPLHLVGLGDLWVNDADPEKAFSHVKKGQNTIALMHNPEGMTLLRDFPADVVLSGHTHGARNKLSAAPGWQVKNRNYHAGLYEVYDKMLYVNRGLGRLGRTRLNCRPEITVFTL